MTLPTPPAERTFTIAFVGEDLLHFTDGWHRMTVRRVDDPVRLCTVQQLNATLTSGTVGQPGSLSLLGLNLYKLLFFNEQADEWMRSLLARRPRQPLTLRLVFEAIAVQAPLAALPWEYLQLPDDWSAEGMYLAEGDRITIVRQVRRPGSEEVPCSDRAAAPPGRKPRVLVVDSLPPMTTPPQSRAAQTLREGDGRARPAGTVLPAPCAEMDELLVTLEGLQTVETKLLREPTQQALEQAIIDFAPCILHLTGHGRCLGEAKSEYHFNLRMGVDRWMSETDLAKLLELAPRMPRLVVLQSCSGGSGDPSRLYPGAAARLASRGVPNVIAMQGEVTLQDAQQFISSFYAELGEGVPVAAALTLSRRRLARNRFGLPVGFVQDPEPYALPARKTQVDPGLTGQHALAGAASNPRDRSPAATEQPRRDAAAAAAEPARAVPEPPPATPTATPSGRERGSGGNLFSVRIAGGDG